MTYDFLITLRSPRVNLYGYITQFMLLLAAVAFTMHLFDPIPTERRIAYAIIIFLMFAFWLMARLGLIGRSLDYTSYRWALNVAALGWLMAVMPMQVLAILFIGMSLLEKPVNIPQEIGFDKYGITFNSFPKRFVPWERINNVVLKDDLLTIDYTSNKLFQRDIDPGTEPTVEEEFNRFCDKQTRGF